MKKFLGLFLVLMVLISAFSCKKKSSSGSDSGKIKIGISKIVAHPALDAVEKGIKDYLKEHNIDASIDVQNANGDIATSAQIAQKFKADKKQVVVGISTPTALSLANVFNQKSGVPVVFSAVTDPVSAGLVDSWQGSEKTNVCGVSDITPVEEQLRIFANITKAKKIGNIYASGETNSIILKDMIQAACKNLGLELITNSVANSGEVKTAIQTIIDRVDAVYIAPDNTVISALASVSDVAKSKNIPLFVADPSNFNELESLIAWGFDYYSIGLETGSMIEKILQGENAGKLGSVKLTDPSKFELHINLDNAKKLKLDIPENLINNATTIIENGAVKEVK